MTEDSNTEQKIIATARRIFLERGLDGARMQDIADEAGINKALLHYYFRSKEKLFEIIFNEQRKKFKAVIDPVIKSDLSIIEKIKKIIDNQTDVILENPKMPLFMMTEIAKNPGLLLSIPRTEDEMEPFKMFMKQIKQEGKEGKIREVTPEFLWMNILSLNMFPFVGMPLLMSMLRVDEEEFIKIIKKRKKELTEFVVHAISTGK